MWAVMVPVWLAGVSVMQAEAPAAAVEASAEAAPVESIEAAPADAVDHVGDAIDPSTEQTIVEPVEEGTKRWYSVTASLTHAQLLIVDQDWTNDHYLVATVGGTMDLVGPLKAFARIGLTQRFVTGLGAQSATEMRDTELGVSMPQQLALAFIGVPRTAELNHRFTVVLPTSDTNLERDLIMAPDLRSSATVPVLLGLSAGVQARAQYRWYRYAEQPGPGGGMLPQLVTSLGAVVEYTAPEALTRGDLTASAGITQGWTKDYASREDYDTPASRQHYWDYPIAVELGLSYTHEKLQWLTASAGLDWGSSLMREGSFNLVPFGRDETELSVTVSAKY